MRKILLCQTTVLATILAVAARVPSPDSGDRQVVIGGVVYVLDADNNTATITGFERQPSSSTTLNIGSIESLGTIYTVVKVAEEAFFDCFKLTSVSLPNVTEIGSRAFGCSSVGDSSLTFVSLPNVVSIGKEAFRCCDKLASFNFPNATTIGESAFDYCSKMTSITLPSAISIGDEAFMTCENLTSVSLPKATSIGSYAFKYCQTLTSVFLPSAETVGDMLFDRWDGAIYLSTLAVIYTNEKIKRVFEDNRRNFWIPDNAVITSLSLTKDQIMPAEWKMVLMSNDKMLDNIEYKYACDYFGVEVKEEPQIVPQNAVAVSKTEIAAAKAEMVTVENGVVALKVGVVSNDDFTAPTANWANVEITPKNVEVKDGKVVISIPVNTQQGFMILQTGDAKIKPTE